MTTYNLDQMPNTHDRDLLRKGRCPWCTEKLSPVFADDEHIADECLECEDRFYPEPRQ